MKHGYCGCPQCGERRPPPPPRPPKKCERTQSVLLQKICCCERRSFPAHCASLLAEEIPCWAKPPFTLCMVQQSGAPPWWTPLENAPHDRRLCMRVYIPVCMQVQDACGKWFSANGTVELDMALSPSCALSECWQYQTIIYACVRMCQPPVCSDNGCFEVRLEAVVELFLVRPEPCAMRRHEPPCPELPLYPPPCDPTPPCWQQCPAAPRPCGWPKQG